VLGWGSLLFSQNFALSFPSDFLVSAKVKVDSVAAKKKPQQAFRTKKHVCTFDRKKERKKNREGYFIAKGPHKVSSNTGLLIREYKLFMIRCVGRKEGNAKLEIFGFISNRR
jgi:hypothetical protein